MKITSIATFAFASATLNVLVRFRFKQKTHACNCMLLLLLERNVSSHTVLISQIKLNFFPFYYFNDLRSTVSCSDFALAVLGASQYFVWQWRMALRPRNDCNSVHSLQMASRKKIKKFSHKWKVNECAIHTAVSCSTESSVGTDFELIQVDSWCRNTDRKNGVGVFDWTGETQQADVIHYCIVIVTRMWNHARDTRIDGVWIWIIGKDGTESNLQAWSI